MDSIGLPFKAATTLYEYDEGLDPEVDAPSRTTNGEFWFEADGKLVTDPKRIAQIEAGIDKLKEAVSGESQR